MPEIRVVKIVFDTKLKNFEVPAFRGAIINLVGRNHVAFHNHVGEDQFVYSYPVIQYKSHGFKAGIVCVESGVDEIHEFFIKNQGVIKIGNNERPLMVENISINRFNVGLREELFAYHLKDWLPLNSKNYQKYQGIEDIGEKLSFLERILIGNILSFAKGINWTVEDPIRIHLSDIPKIKPIKYKGQNLLSFDLAFKTNVFLPFDIGLGKGASVGFGTLLKNQKI